MEDLFSGSFNQYVLTYSDLLNLLPAINLTKSQASNGVSE